MKRISIAILIIGLVTFCGCGQSWKTAITAFDRGTATSDSVSTAYFVKAWGLNRALITESRQKWVKECQLRLMRAEKESKLDLAKMEETLAFLESEIGKDEAVVSQNFAYLSYLLVMHERSQQMLGNVDFKLEADKPILLSASEQAREGIADAQAEIKLWEPLIGSLGQTIPDILKRSAQRGVVAIPTTQEATIQAK